MKLINRFWKLSGMLALLVAVGACDSEVDYSLAEIPAGAQVYFPTTMPAQVDLDRESDSFEIQLMRADKSGALTIDLAVTDESGLFTIPTTATFNEGDESATITIGYDPEDFTYDDYKDITLAVKEDISTPYGNATYSFKAGIPAPWESLGMATFSDLFIFEGKYEVELQRNLVDGRQYRLVDPYSEALKTENLPTQGNQSEYLEFTIFPAGSTVAGITTTIDNLVLYTDFNTGYYESSYGEDIYAIHPYRFGMPEGQWAHNIVTHVSSEGEPEVVQLAPYYYLFNSNAAANYTQYDGVITIAFPGVVIKDYAVSITYKGRFTDVDDNSFAVADITLGEDIENAKLAIVEGDDIDAALAGILDGSIETMDVSASGTVNVPNSYNGLCSIVVVGFAEDEAQEFDYATFEFSVSTSAWQSLGTGLYTDDILIPLYGLEPVSYPVEIQENTEAPGLYRLVNPYGEVYPYNEPGDWDDSKNYYMEIDAQDPDGVFITLQNTGLDWGEGLFYVYSLAAYYMDNGYSLEKAKEAGVCGTLVDGVITFPIKTLLWMFDADGPYYGNMNNAFQVVLPEAMSQQAQAIPANPVAKRASSLRRETLKEVPVLKKKRKYSTGLTPYQLLND